MTSTPDAKQNFEKCTELYFEDGDIVVSAQRQGSDTVSLFKLHRRVLAMHAQGLAGILDFPDVSQDGFSVNKRFEGTPIVRLFDDPADLAKFFKAIYSPSTLILRRSIATNAADVFPLLVLADKYVADDIECMIEYQIRQDWPKELSEWDASEQVAVQVYRMHQERGLKGPWDALVPEPASYIRLARIAKVFERTRIAAAFYQLSRMKSMNEWGTKSSERSPKDPTPMQLAKVRRAMWSILSKDEVQRLERGKERIKSHMVWIVRTLHKRNNLCVPCSRGWEMVGKRLVESEDILADLLSFCGADTPLSTRVCHGCSVRISRILCAERVCLWAKLPDFFEVYPNERAGLDIFCEADSELMW